MFVSQVDISGFISRLRWGEWLYHTSYLSGKISLWVPILKRAWHMKGGVGGLDKEAGGHRAPTFTSEVSHIFVASLENSRDIQHSYSN